MREARSLKSIDHRPWPLPDGPWVMAQRWLDLLFAHWPVPTAWLRDQIPAGLEIDSFEGQAWVGVVPFRMEGVRPRFSPAVPGLSAFPELNVRTYVRHRGKAGVWFFSLDAANLPAVRIARKWFHLPYYDANMSLSDKDRVYHYRSHRTHKKAYPANFKGWYKPMGAVYKARQGTLEHWLTERYCLYTSDARGRLICGDIHHAPWPLQRVEAGIQLNTMTQPLGLKLPDTDPLLHFSKQLDVVVWAPYHLEL